MHESLIHTAMAGRTFGLGFITFLHKIFSEFGEQYHEYYYKTLVCVPLHFRTEFGRENSLSSGEL